MKNETRMSQSQVPGQTPGPPRFAPATSESRGVKCMNRVPGIPQATFGFADAWELGTDLPTARDSREPQPNYSELKRWVSTYAAALSHTSDRVTRVEETLQTITSALCRIEVAVNQRSLLDDEVRRFRSKELRDDIQGPLFRGLIRLLDRIAEERPRIEQIRALCRRTTDPAVGRVLQWIVDTRAADKADLLNVLAQFGVQRYRSKPGITLDGARHERVEVIATTRVELHGRIARHRRYGYHRPDDDWVVRRERVDVYAANSE
jgi:hypothetical protein